MMPIQALLGRVNLATTQIYTCTRRITDSATIHPLVAVLQASS